MNKIIKLAFVLSTTLFLSACWHVAEEVVKAEKVIETDIAPHSSK
ncbi:hypothetical protein [Candidatus Thioglobus sp.]|jgi:hypothetical protein